MGREAIYELLAAKPGEYLSGEDLSERLGISRAAVWKAVESLRKKGCTIEARPGLGYCLSRVSDALTLREMARYGSCSRDNIICLETVDSTNSYAKRIATEGAPDGTIVVADCQSAGRGRMSRSFLSPAGQGVYLTVLWRPSLPPEQLLPLTALGAVAVCGAVEKAAGIRPGIKWTNDLVLGNRKICGILTEMALEGETGLVQYVVMGIGVNVHQRASDFPPELSSIASSLDEETGQFVSRPRLAAAMVEELDRLHREALCDPAAWLTQYRRDCLTLQKQVQLVRGEEREEVFAVDVDDQYGLVVRRQNGETAVIRSGEVSVRGMYGYI